MKFIYKRILSLIMVLCVSVTLFTFPSKAIEFPYIKTKLNEIARTVGNITYNIALKAGELLGLKDGAKMALDLIAGDKSFLSDLSSKLKSIDWESGTEPIKAEITGNNVIFSLNQSYPYKDDGEKLFYTLLTETYTALMNFGIITVDIFKNNYVSSNFYQDVIDTSYEVALSHVSSGGGTHGGGGRHRDEEGNTVVAYPENSITYSENYVEIGGYKFNVRGTQPYTISELDTKIEGIYKDYGDPYMIIPFFENDGVIYINLSNKSYVGNQVYLTDCENVGIKIMDYNSTRNAYSLQSNFANTTSNKAIKRTDIGFFRFSKLDLSTEYYMEINYIDYKFLKYFVNIDTGIVHSLNEFESVNIKFIEIPAYFYTDTKKKFGKDILRYEVGKPEAMSEIINSSVVTFPKTETEKIIDKSKEAGVINNNTVIELDDDGIKKVGDLTIEELLILFETVEDDKLDEETLDVLGKILKAVNDIKDLLVNGFDSENGNNGIQVYIDDIIQEISVIPTSIENGFLNLTNVINEVKKISTNILNSKIENNDITIVLNDILQEISIIPTSIENSFLNIINSITISGSENDYYNELNAIIDEITKIPDKITDTLLDGISLLFIPSEDYFENHFNIFKTEIDKKIPVLSQITSYQSILKNYLSGVSNDVPKFEIEIYGAKVKIFDLSFFKDYRVYVHGIILTVAYLYFFKKIINRITKIIE